MLDTLSISVPFVTSSLPFVGSPVMVWIIDHEGIVQFIEEYGFTSFIKLPDDVIGLTIFEVYADYPDILDKIHLAQSGKRTRAFINHGESYWECQFYPIDGVQDNHNSVIGISFDISLQRQLWYQEALMDIASALRKARTHEEMPPLIVGQLRQLLQIDQAALVIGYPPEHPYQLIFSWGDWDQICENNEPITRLLTDPLVIKDLNSNGQFEENYI